MKIIIFGGTGFIGSSLSNHLAASGYEPVQVARNKPIASQHRFVAWDATSVGDWKEELEGARAIVNLTGRTVDCVKTPEHIDEILRSRVASTRIIGEALKQVKIPPPVWVQMSTGHIYGDPPRQICTEDSAFGYGLAPDVGRAWEAALREALPSGMREVRLRTSFVVGRDGGALGRLWKLTKLGLGGTCGSGAQGMSWIHEADMNRIIQQAVENETYRGPYICTAPNPVSNKIFMKTLRKALGIPFGLPAPAFAIRIAAPLLLKTDPELAIYGRYLKSTRLEEAGFVFRFPYLAGALEDLCK